MKINYLKINGFGKLVDKEIRLENNINLIYGKNESGKTTLLKFISSMFFGSCKNKNGKEISDFDKYIPWSGEEFSGKIEYSLDKGESFEVFRDFKKKNPIIYNENKEDISKQFNIDKTKGNEFFYEQTKMDETLLFITSIVEQKEVVLDSQSQNTLTQKISNLLSTGNDNISYQKTINQLNKKLIEEVGTDRTIGRPINNIIEKIKVLNGQKKMLEEYISRKEEIKIKKINLKKDLENKSLNIELIKEIKKIKEEEELEKEKIKIKDNIKKEHNQKIIELENKFKNENNSGKNENKNKINMFNSILIFILIAFNICINILNVNKVLEYVVVGGTIIYLAYNLIVFIKNKNKLNKIRIKNNNEEIKVKKELEIIKENRNEIEKEIEKFNSELNNKNKIKYNSIKNKYYEIDEYDFNKLFRSNLNEIENTMEIERNNYDNIRVELNTIEIEEKNIIDGLEKKALYEEELSNLEEEKEDLMKLEMSINFAREALENAYGKMKSEITPKFTKDLSSLVEEISNGKYRNVSFSDEYGLRVELDNGKYVDGSLLSLGTMDQLYLSLRLSTIKEISEEKMPIILDESFVYYDKERLKSIFRYLNERCSDFQIIIFSCSSREKEIMEELKISYNMIEL